MHNGTSRSEKGSEKFVSFASLHFNLIGNNLGKLLKWEGGTYLTGPLLNLRPSLVSLALKANLLIVGYMDHSNNEIHKECIDYICDNDVHLIYDLVKLGCQGSLDNSDEIRDEIFCQLVKQTTKNSNRRSCLRGYQLILCCLAGFSPTESLAPFLLSHIRVGCRGGALLSRRSVRLAEDCMGALQKIQILGSRTWGISRSEIFAVVSEKFFLSVKVWISQNITLDVAVDSWSTIADVKLLACEILGIQCSSILTLSMTANLNSELSSESNVASLRGLMNVLFNESRGKLLELIDKKSKKLKASARAKTLASLSEKALSTIDSLFQLKELSYLNFRGANPFNSSEACLFMESVQAEKNEKRSSCFLCTPSFFSPRSLDLGRLLGRKKPSRTNFAFKIRLVVWIYPYSQRCEDIDQDHLKRCKLADHYQQRGSNCQPVIFDREVNLSMTPSHDECHLSERGINLNACTRWPSDEIVREILFGQLIESTSGSLDDFHSLRMAGLMFAVQHQDGDELLQDGLTWTSYMQKVVSKHLDGAIPSLLTALEVWRRKDTAATIRELLIAIKIELPSSDRIECQQHPNSEYFDLEKFASFDKSNCKIQSTTHGDVINLVEDFLKNSVWSDDKVWRDFLCEVIIHFWQHYRSRSTVEKCRDEFLSSAKKRSGYGTHRYYPSGIKIGVQTLQHELASYQPNSLKSYLSDDNNNNICSISPKPLIWASVESYLTCQISEEVVHDLKELNTIKKSLQLSICSEKIVVTEITIVQVKSMCGKSDVLSSTETFADVQKIMLLDIVCWGYDDQSITIKFKQRGNGHEASYYSDDEDEGTTSSKIKGSAMRLNQDGSEHFVQSSTREDDEFNDNCCSTSIASITSGCPIYPTYRYQKSEDEMSCKKFSRPLMGGRCSTRQKTLENIFAGYDDVKIHQSRAPSREVPDYSDQIFYEDLSVGSIIMSGSDHNSGCLEDCKQIDTDDATFRTDASSDLDSRNKFSVNEKKSKAKNSITQTVANEVDTDEICVNFRYGAEMAELLKLYCLRSVEVDAAKNS